MKKKQENDKKKFGSCWGSQEGETKQNICLGCKMQESDKKGAEMK